MIGYLEGTALAADTLLVHGVGYQVHTAAPMTVGQDVQVWVHTVVRETELSLYGFPTTSERDLFLALMKAPGVGAKMALAFLGLGSDVLARALREQDTRTLSRVPGVGPKKAIAVLGAVTVPDELLAQLSTAGGDVSPGAQDLIAALVTMGHPAAAAREAVLAVHREDAQVAPGLALRRALVVLNARAARSA